MLRHVLRGALLSLAAFVLLFSTAVRSQPDPTFGSDGSVSAGLPGADWLLGAFLLEDGKILLACQNQNTTHYLLRFNGDGTPDTSFGNNGSVILPIPYIAAPGSRLYARAIRQSDGKIVLVGEENNDGAIVRFHENGELDTGFSDDGISRPNLDQTGRDWLSVVVQQPDGKLVAAGAFYNFKTTLIRYNENGDLDPAFGTDGFIIHEFFPKFDPCSIAIQSSGKIVINGLAGNSIFAVRRFNADGGQDSNFVVSTIETENDFVPFLLLADDKFLVAARQTVVDHLLQQHSDSVVRAHNADGSVNTSFGDGGSARVGIARGMDDWPTTLTEQSDGRLLIGGTALIDPNRGPTEGLHIGLARLLSDGSLDGKQRVTPGILGGVYNGQPPGKLLVQPDGKILAIGVRGDDLLISRRLGVPLQDYTYHGTPYSFGLSTNPNVANATVYRPSTREWFIGPGPAHGSFFGSTGDILVPGDYLGNNFRNLDSELAVFRPSNGTWYIAKQQFMAAQNFIAIQWGKEGDIPVPADYDGDGKDDVAVFRPSDGIWYIRNGSDGSFRFQQWGTAGDKPVTGDYDGDGIYDIAVWRPSNGVWYILRSSDGQASYTFFGLDGDVPVQEDYDGDGKFDIAVRRSSTGLWYVLRSSDAGVIYSDWGLPSDVPVPADYDGDDKTDLAVWRPASRIWYINYSSGAPTQPFIWGLADDIPVQGRFP